MNVNGLFSLLLLLMLYPANVVLFLSVSAHTIFTSSLVNSQYCKMLAISVTLLIKKKASQLLLPFILTNPSFLYVLIMLAAFRYGLFVLSRITFKLSVSFHSALISSIPSSALGVNSGEIGVADIKQQDLYLLKLLRTPPIALYLQLYAFKSM